MAKYWNYTSYWNLVNYPAAVFPTGLHVESSDVNDDNKDNNITNHGWRNDTEREIWASYDPEVSLGVSRRPFRRSKDYQDYKDYK
jgi:amidase